MSVLIRNVLCHGEVQDVLIQGNRFSRIGPGLDIRAEQVLDGSGQAILPSFVNGHTHAAMTLLRGFADDMDLHTWLHDYIWPLEARLTPEDVTIGAKLACLEMIKSGTTFFNDMYWHYEATASAVEEMGIRAALSSVFIDFNDPETAQRRWRECLELYEGNRNASERVTFALGPHAIYSVGRDSLLKARDFARENGVLIHLHLGETEKEFQDARQQWGLTPVEYLNSLDLLGPNLCACHAIWLTEGDMDLLAEKNVKVIHNPASNLKLCSGFFPYAGLKSRGICIGLGTDGCSSNNNLDMLEEMKIASLMAKAWTKDPTSMPASEIFDAATRSGARIFGLDCGEIREGWVADCILVDLNHPQLVPNHTLISNLVYSANGDCVRSTICNGRVLMHDRQVEGEEEILARAREAAERLARG
jgi:5-methylthioadenosine/S-adenosylhomocysteine deaminase